MSIKRYWCKPTPFYKWDKTNSASIYIEVEKMNQRLLVSGKQCLALAKNNMG